MNITKTIFFALLICTQMNFASNENFNDMDKPLSVHYTGKKRGPKKIQKKEVNIQEISDHIEQFIAQNFIAFNSKQSIINIKSALPQIKSESLNGPLTKEYLKTLRSNKRMLERNFYTNEMTYATKCGVNHLQREGGELLVEICAINEAKKRKLNP